MCVSLKGGGWVGDASSQVTQKEKERKKETRRLHSSCVHMYTDKTDRQTNLFALSRVLLLSPLTVPIRVKLLLFAAYLFPYK